jgi:hypothetical protein
VNTPAREEDASVGEVRYQAVHEGYEVDIVFFAILSARTLRHGAVPRIVLAEVPLYGEALVGIFAARMNAPIATTLPKLLNAIGDERTAKTILGAPFHTARLLACLEYVHAEGDCVVDVLSMPQHPRENAYVIHVRGRDWRVALMSMAATCEVKGAVRL